MKEKYMYAVARVRAKETTLLRKQDMDQLLDCKTADDAITILKDKGFGDPNDKNLNQMIQSEYKKLWGFVNEIAGKEKELELFFCPIDYTNLKSAIKIVLTNSSPDRVFLQNSSIKGENLYEIIKTDQYDLLPEHMRYVAKEAKEILLHTGDSQLCDILIDKATLKRMLQIGNDSQYEIITQYVNQFVMVSNIKIAVRGFKMSKNLDFFLKALVECDSLDIGKLAVAATKSLDEIYNYLYDLGYSDMVEHLKVSEASFEKWCDNHILNKLYDSKYDAFSFVPVFAYVFIRDNEIKSIRKIVLCKIGALDNEIIKERLRDMYA